MKIVGFQTVVEVVVRTTLVTLLTYLVMRVRGRKQIAQLSTFDLVMVIALGSAVGDAMIYSEETIPFLRSFVAIATVLAIVEALEYALARAPRSIAQLAHGRPTLLVTNGKLLRKNLEASNLTEDQLLSLMREHDVDHYTELVWVLLEPDGQISIRRRSTD